MLRFNEKLVSLAIKT